MRSTGSVRVLLPFSTREADLPPSSSGSPLLDTMLMP
jgi:hypothetical protein